MAGAGSKLFTSGSVLTADQVNTYLMDQTIMKFASTSARDAAFGGVGEATLAEGMFAYTTDTNTLWLYNGSSWVNVLGSDIGEQALSNRNVIINGAMQVAQRGTSTASITADGYFTVDRFGVIVTTAGTWTQSQEADYPSGSGLARCAKMLCTTADASLAAGDLITFRQLLEGQNLQQFAKGTASAKPFALSFWVKSNVTGTYICELRDGDNTRSVSASYTINASATWEKKTIIFPADTTGLFDNDNNRSLDVNFCLAAGSTYTSGTLATTWVSTTNANRYVGQTNLASAINNYWQVTGVQLEAGSVATPFEFEDYGTTLRKCQRYFYLFRTGTAGVSGFVDTTSKALFYLYYPTMRVSSTGTMTATDFEVRRGGTTSTAGSSVNISGGETCARIDLTVGTANLTVGQGVGLAAISGEKNITFSAEL